MKTQLKKRRKFFITFTIDTIDEKIKNRINTGIITLIFNIYIYMITIDGTIDINGINGINGKKISYLKEVIMTDEKFKSNYYNPFLETWKILKLIQYADKTSDSDAQWQRYMSEIDRLSVTYPNDPFVDKLIRFLLDAGDVIAKENQKERTYV